MKGLISLNIMRKPKYQLDEISFDFERGMIAFISSSDEVYCCTSFNQRDLTHVIPYIHTYIHTCNTTHI